ncbi:MAG: hypothetical protein OXF50_10630 [Caldilineaceae bacterium]|nr:hypothetical protein [Caldilineaceae bacterium]
MERELTAAWLLREVYESSAPLWAAPGLVEEIDAVSRDVYDLEQFPSRIERDQPRRRVAGMGYFRSNDSGHRI